jgi:hypothetical protein
MTITSSILLSNNLLCSGDGLIVDTNSAVIDLGGHTIRGHNGVGTGITVRPAPPGSAEATIRIRNGTVEDFNNGIAVGRSTTIRSLRISGNPGSGVSFIPHSIPAPFITTAVLNSYVDQNGFAFGNGGTPGTLGVVNLSHNFIAWNHIVGQFGSGTGTATAVGQVVGNEIAFNGSGFDMTEFGGGIFQANEFWQNDGDAIRFFDDCPTAVGNGFFFNTGAAIEGGATGRGHVGVSCTYSDNSMWDNGEGIAVNGIGVEYVISGNLVTSNGVAGIWVDGPVTSTVRGNNVARNGAPPPGGSPRDVFGAVVQDGIHIGHGGFLQGNQARGNFAYGIFAPTATDGGNNIGSGNGNPAECVGVVC